MTSTHASLEEGATIRVAGLDTHFHEGGTGETVVFIHGSGPGVTAWANWRVVLPAVAERFHVLAPDLVGFGYSARPPGATYGKELWVEHLLAFLDARGVKRASIVGNSMGGALALAVAVRRPELVHKLVLMGSVGLSFPITPGLDAVWGYEPSIEVMRSLIADCFAYDRSIATDDLVRLRYEASVQPGFQESYGSMFPAPRQRGVEDLATPEEQIAALAMPALLMHGREDRVIPMDVSLRLFNLIPNAELHLFGHCGHWTQIERRAEFTALVMDFLAR